MDACCAVLVGLPPRVHLEGWRLSEVRVGGSASRGRGGCVGVWASWFSVVSCSLKIEGITERGVGGLLAALCARAFALLGSLWFLIEGG